MKNRIWELDGLRGLLIIGMVVVHILYDLSSLLGLFDLSENALYQFVKNQGGVLFFLLSGLCATLGSRNFRRGLTVLFCGLLVSLVTWGMFLLKLSGKELIIYFGVLHCLGLCMMLWSFFRRWPLWGLLAGGALLIAAGFYVQSRYFDFGFLPLGFRPHGFATSDYFPLLPFLGFFLWGAVLGKTLYRDKRTLFPKVNIQNPLIRFLIYCGRRSLPIYLLHQPLLLGICALLSYFF